MDEILTVHSYAEFQAAIEQFSTGLYRGQTKHYPGVIPSAFRARPFPDTGPLLDPAQALYFAAHRVDELADAARQRDWEDHDRLMKFNDSRFDDEEEPRGWFDRLFGRLFKIDTSTDPDETSMFGFDPMNIPFGHGFGAASDYDEHVGLQWRYALGKECHFALLQHYRAPSPVLDVSYDPAVALWFATHQFVRDQAGDRAWYEPSRTPGVVYVMSAPDGRVVDLREGETVPIAGLRGRRQQGGLLIGATADAPDLATHVTARVTIRPGTFDAARPELGHLSQAYLFPPPEEDAFYNVLLEAKTSADSAIRGLARHIVDYRSATTGP